MRRLILLADNETISAEELKTQSMSEISCVARGLRYYLGFLCTKDYNHAFLEFKEAYDNNESAFAAIMYANLLLSGIPACLEKKERHKAVGIYRALMKDSITAMYNYAYCLELGLFRKK
ncbi:MAG: hypothetical protein LBQ68_06225, partial [Clostridiales bacterium]|nr:hypothetical protein [Clostridiales bacterium]